MKRLRWICLAVANWVESKSGYFISYKHYKVSKQRIEKKIIYTAWRGNKALGYFNNAEEAKRECERDYENKAQ